MRALRQDQAGKEELIESSPSLLEPLLKRMRGAELTLLLAASSLLLARGFSAQESQPAKEQPQPQPQPQQNDTTGPQTSETTLKPSAPPTSSAPNSTPSAATPAPPSAAPVLTPASLLGSSTPASTPIIYEQTLGQLVDGVKTIVDLSHPLGDKTLHWPTNTGFQYMNLTDGEQRIKESNESYYLKSDGFTMAIHTGTHLDAPRHFNKDGWTVDRIPLERLIDVPVHVVDLSHKVKANRSYQFEKEDFIDAKTNQSSVEPGSVVLVYTGISQLYNMGEEAYFGTDTKNISELLIPGFGEEAARYLGEDRRVFGVGLDSPSADSSANHGKGNPAAHIVFCSNNIYILENINNKLAGLVGNKVEMRLTVAPLPLVGGSGSPVRLVAVTNHDDCRNRYYANNSANNKTGYLLTSTVIFAVVSSVLTLIISRSSLFNYTWFI